jgi:large subunit ribosomal protein L10
MLKADKIKFVEELTTELKDAKSVVLVNYTGLNVKAQQELKKRLKAVGSDMVVVKNTLLKRSGEAAGIDSSVLTDGILQGQTAIIISTEDAVAPIQIIGKFSKEFEVPKFKVGVVEGSVQDEAGLSKLSTLPGRDALLGQVLGSLMSNLYGLVGTLNSPMQQLVYTLNAKATQGQ